MKTRKYFQGYRITHYDNDANCYVHFYDNMDCTRPNNQEIGFAYAKRKFNISNETYMVSREEGKTIYTRINH